MKRFVTTHARSLGAGLLFLLMTALLVLRPWQKEKPHVALKYSYTVLVANELLEDGNWPGLWEPLQARFPNVEFVIRPLMTHDEDRALPPFDLIIGRKSLMERAQAAKALEMSKPFLETGFQLMYYRLEERSSVPENWTLLNLEGQNYFDAEQQKFLLAAPDHALTFLPALVAQKGASTEIFELMRDLRLGYRSVPLGCQVGCAVRLFQEGKSPLLWHSDRYLGELSQQYGDKLGLAPLPKLNEHVLRTPRQTIFLGQAARPLQLAKAVSQELFASWQGTAGARLIFKNLHRVSSDFLSVQEGSGDRTLDQLKLIVQNFTIPMDDEDQARVESGLRPIVNQFLTADLSTLDAAKRSDRVR